jgi:hypothetical protein
MGLLIRFLDVWATVQFPRDQTSARINLERPALATEHSERGLADNARLRGLDFQRRPTNAKSGRVKSIKKIEQRAPARSTFNIPGSVCSLPLPR